MTDAKLPVSSAGVTRVLRLIEIMAALRNPESGCPWDIKQTFSSVAPYTIEEAYEVADAIERGDMADLKDELGDLLLQVVYHSRIAEEQGLFSFADVADAICAKMIRRHPHVFGDGARDGGDHSARWEEIKAAERAAKADKQGRQTQSSILDGVPAGLPAVVRSMKLQKKAASAGFDWPSVADCFAKLDEEVAELKAEIEADDCPEAAARRFEEFGDVLSVLVNAGMHLGIDPEAALRAANEKFTGRIHAMEKAATSQGRTLKGMPLAEMEALWQAAKAKNNTP